MSNFFSEQGYPDNTVFKALKRVLFTLENLAAN